MDTNGRFDAVIFDLDGTLLDTLADLADAVNDSLVRRGTSAHSTESYRLRVGWGIRHLVESSLPPSMRSAQTIEEMVREVSTRLVEHPVIKTRPYPGVAELLSELNRRGLGLAILTNKPKEVMQVVVKQLLGAWRFGVIQGADPALPRKPDPTAALQLARTLGVQPPRTLFVGDSDVDMQTANAAGMYGVGAEWGFRTVDELRENGAKVTIGSPLELLELL